MAICEFLVEYDGSCVFVSRGDATLLLLLLALCEVYVSASFFFPYLRCRLAGRAFRAIELEHIRRRFNAHRAENCSLEVVASRRHATLCAV
jgi:hypothetical protein